eukprot:gene3937-4306_t
MNSTEEANSETIGLDNSKKNDSILALTLLVGAVIIVIFVLYNIWRSRTGQTKDNQRKRSSFTPPHQRADYLEAKNKLDITIPEQRDHLRKLLMKRALHTVPLIMTLQNDGSSIDRLYKKGMLTDDMHFHARELKAFIDQEIEEVSAEADLLAEGWSQAVWQQALQIQRVIQKQIDGKGSSAGEEEEEGEDATGESNEDSASQRAAEAKKAEANAKKREKAKERAKKLAALKDIGMPSAEEVAAELIEQEEKEKAAQGSAGKVGGKGKKTTKK